MKTPLIVTRFQPGDQSALILETFQRFLIAFHKEPRSRGSRRKPQEWWPNYLQPAIAGDSTYLQTRLRPLSRARNVIRNEPGAYACFAGYELRFSDGKAVAASKLASEIENPTAINSSISFEVTFTLPPHDAHTLGN